MDVGKRICEARRSRGMTQRELADRTGVDYTYISKIENNAADYPPSLKVIRSLAQALDLDSRFWLINLVKSPAPMLRSSETWRDSMVKTFR